MSTAKVFVGSLPPGSKPEELRHLFTNYGVVVECDIMNRCGFVHLETIEMAETAIAALNGVEFKGHNLVVEPGRAKDRRGGGGGSNGVGPTGNRRPIQAHDGGSFSRGNNFRGGGAGHRGRGSVSNDSNFGPMRNEGNFRQQRNAPYNKSHSQQNQSFDNHASGYKNKFNQGAGNGGHNDYYGGNSAGGSNGHPRGSGMGGRGASNNSDRRGFALPAVDSQPQQQQHQQLGYEANQGRFANGPMAPNGSSDNGMFQRNRNNAGMNRGTPGGRGGSGGFQANRGGFSGRGSFNSRRGAGAGVANGPSNNMPQNHGGGFNKHAVPSGPNHKAPNSYQMDFPPLPTGGRGGGVSGNRGRFNGPGPRPQHMGGNRRF
ncbi:CG7903 [Drosophila busckii]|uniref:CG7903 n=1 Tax=Drosophila busckii TaxID=30019 RepID=A0A0M4EM82_DROBS|nr:heterogeneous nuclear ribonucleoprotein A3 [Drosophila busckii]ALC46527.1 CG7903 [Drosophila busckii]